MPASRLLAIGLSLFGVACATSQADVDWVHKSSLEESQRRYSQLVRWGEIDRASRFVDPALRQEFLDQRDAFETIRITDFEIGRILPGDEDGLVEVQVTYHGYSLTSFVARPLRETQVWYWSDDEEAWLVRPRLAALIEGVAGRSP